VSAGRASELGDKCVLAVAREGGKVVLEQHGRSESAALLLLPVLWLRSPWTLRHSPTSLALTLAPSLLHIGSQGTRFLLAQQPTSQA
jgi:hypothetical protein